MRNLRLLCLLLLGLAALVPGVRADTLTELQERRLIKGIAHGNYTTTDATPAFYVLYTGDTTLGGFGIEVLSSSNIEFIADDGTSDTGVSTDGLIVDTGLTFGQICDTINASADNNGDGDPDWMCTLGAVLPSATAADKLLADPFTAGGAASATVPAYVSPEGYAIYLDTSDADIGGVLLGFEGIDNDYQSVSGASSPCDGNAFLARATDGGTRVAARSEGGTTSYRDGRVELNYALVNLTGAASAATLKVYAVKGHGASATEILLATIVGDTDASSAADFSIGSLSAEVPLFSPPPGFRILLTYSNATTTAVTMQATGRIWRN